MVCPRHLKFIIGVQPLTFSLNEMAMAIFFCFAQWHQRYSSQTPLLLNILLLLSLFFPLIILYPIMEHTDKVTVLDVELDIMNYTMISLNLSHSNSCSNKCMYS